MKAATDLLSGPILAATPGLVHAFGTRAGRLYDALPMPIARLRQVHGNRVHALDSTATLEPFLEPELDDRPEGDALVTDRRGLTVAVATADCVPVLIGGNGVVAAVHAGWRGLVAGVIPATLGVISSRFGRPASALVAAIGPCAGAAAYEVSDEVREAFRDAGLAGELFAGTRPGHWLCDLAAAANTQLRDSGVPEVDLLGRCTVSEPRSFHSWRRDGAAAGRMLSGIALTP